MVDFDTGLLLQPAYIAYKSKKKAQKRT